MSHKTGNSFIEKSAPSKHLELNTTYLNTVSLFEFIDSAACVYEFLSAGEERMAFAANIHLHRISFFRGTGLKGSTASAGDCYLVIIGMYFGFHVFTSLLLLFYFRWLR